MADLPIQQAQGAGYCVYFAERDSDDLIKIGYTRDWRQRQYTLKSAVGSEIYTLGLIFVINKSVAQKMERNILTVLGCTFSGKDHEWLEIRRADICRVARVYHGRNFVTRIDGFSEHDDPREGEQGLFNECLPKRLWGKHKFNTRCSAVHLTATGRQQYEEQRFDDLMLYMRHEGI
jgi:hypothetical protein